MQAQLTVAQGPAHPRHGLVCGLQFKFLGHVEHVVAVAALLLGHVHGLVSVAHQGVGILIVQGEQGDPDTGAQRQPLLAYRIGRGHSP
ncbi:hypothetical protein D3C76_1545060 [compost metagenome]